MLTVSSVSKTFFAGTVNGIRIIGAYIPNGQAVGTDKFAYKMGWLQAPIHLR